MTTLINTVDAKEQFADLLNLVVHNKERIILTRRGKEIAAFIPIEDLELLYANEEKNDLRNAVDALKEARQDGMLSLEQLKEKLGS